MSIENPHDRIFKEIESIRENAADLIAAVFPEELKRKLALETLELDNNSYISQDLQESFSDIVYNCRYGEGTTITITLLFEHKSSPATYPHFQLLRYILGIWEYRLKNKLVPQVVVPVVFYHGKERWIQKRMPEYFSGIDQTLEAFLPSFEYLLTDLSNYDDQAIRERLFKRDANKILMLLMKHIFNETYFAEHFSEIFSSGAQLFELEEGERFLISILMYIFSTTELESDLVIQKLSQISQKGGEIAMTTAMKLKEEGIKEGKIEDARKMLVKGYPVDDIVSITGLSRKEVEALK